MKSSEIVWNANGWTSLQDADDKTHTLGVSILSEDGVVKELRKRHNDGEEEKLTGRIAEGFSLPMDLSDFRDAFEDGKINFKK